jgi:hypothetical protein
VKILKICGFYLSCITRPQRRSKRRTLQSTGYGRRLPADARADDKHRPAKSEIRIPKSEFFFPCPTAAAFS